MTIRLGVNPIRWSSDDLQEIGGDIPWETCLAEGDGMVDYPSVFRELQGYSGWVIIEAEQDPKKARTLPYAKKGVAHLGAALREAGIG